MSARNDNLDLSRSNRISRIEATSSDLPAQKVKVYDSRPSYKRAYALLRYFRGSFNWQLEERLRGEALDCATESYENRKDQFRGWISDARRIKFWDRYHAIAFSGKVVF